MKRDLEALESGHDTPSGMWSNGATIWILENGAGADDAVYAYDLSSGERVEGGEFVLAAENRAPRGMWSNGQTVWVSDSGRERLYAYGLNGGEREEDREFDLAERNRNARGIWSDGETMLGAGQPRRRALRLQPRDWSVTGRVQPRLTQRRPARRLVRRRDHLGLRPRPQGAVGLPPPHEA